MGCLAAASVAWLIIRTGTKPSRITYPCQKAAVANINIFLLVLSAPLLDFGRLKTTLPRGLDSRMITTVLLVGSMLLAFGSVPFTGNSVPIQTNFAPVPLDLQTHNAVSSINSSDLFVVENASGVDGNMDGAVSSLLQLMADHGLPFFKSANQPSGLIGKDDVVIIKVNSQWSQRGGTNTDLVKSIINKIVNHPEGFTGEIVIADNGQYLERSNNDQWWAESNAYNHSQSMVSVVQAFPNYRVSTWLWDTVNSRSVNEYNQGDFTDGYVVNPENPISDFHVSYPKFKTKYGTYISFKNGIWNTATSSYDSGKLKVINVPVLKSHNGFGVSASIKHYMGVLSNSLTDGHGTIFAGSMGTEMAQTRFPTLNILDSIWVNANPIESGSPPCGPDTSYDAASYTNVISASQDPVALDYWASKHILIPAAIAKGYTAYSSLNPDYAPVTSPLTESFHNYLERSMNELKKNGFQVTMNEDEMNVYVSPMLDRSIEQARPSGVTASSYSDGHPPELAIDGVENPSNYWGTNALVPEGHVPQWLKVDLGSPLTINQITTHFYDGAPRTYTYYIEVSNDSSSWTMIVPTKTGSGSVTDTFPQVEARYVRITITANTANPAAHIEEITIYRFILTADINKDGIVNILDIAIVAKAFNSKPGDFNWNQLADIDKNGIVNIVDISRVAKEYGRTA